MAPASGNSRKRTSTPGAKPRPSASENTINQDRKGIDVKSASTSASARAAAALASPPPSRWIRPRFRFVAFMLIVASLGAFVLLQEKPPSSLEELVQAGHVTKDWFVREFDDFTLKLPNRTAQLTESLSELKSKVSYESVSSSAAEAFQKASSFTTVSLSQASTLAAQVHSKLALMQFSEGFWNIVDSVTTKFQGSETTEVPKPTWSGIASEAMEVTDESD